MALFLNRSDLIVSQELSNGEVWNCNVTPFNATKKGNTYTSNTITIGVASTPNPPTLTYPVDLHHYLSTNYTGNISFTTEESLNCSLNDTRFINMTSNVGTSFIFRNSTVNETVQRININITCKNTLNLKSNLVFSFVIDTNPIINYFYPVNNTFFNTNYVKVNIYY